MRFKTPWSPDSAVWSNIRDRASFPGVDGKCNLPALAVSPVIHRFDHLVLLKDGVLNLPSLTEWLPGGSPEIPPGERERTVFWFLGLLGMTLADAIETLLKSYPATALRNAARSAVKWRHRSWELTHPVWGMQLTIEQAWESLGVTLGEPVGAISLAPGEEREVQIFSWYRLRSTYDLETVEIVDKQIMTQLTTHDSYQVMHRLQKEFHWNVKADANKQIGDTIGWAGSIGGSAGGSTNNTIERQFQQTRDLTRKIAEQLRTERKLKVSTAEDLGREERRQHRLSNRNPCHSVTYQFYEELNHYRVRHAPSELIYVIAVPNPLPELSLEWIGCHEGILRENLLDQTVADGFDSVRLLQARNEEGQVARAAQSLAREFRPAPPRESGGGGGWLGGLTSVVGGLFGGTLGSVANLLRDAVAGDGEGPRSDILQVLGNPPTTEGVHGFLEGLKERPSMAGIASAIDLLSRYYADSQLPPGMSEAFGYAIQLLISEGRQPQRGSDPAEVEQEIALDSESIDRERALEEQVKRAQVAYQRLCCHLEEHLLHYMRAIWLSEDPATRYARLAAHSIGGESFWHLAENRLLGFHLNASIFPIYMGEKLESKLGDLIDAEELMALPQDLPHPAGVDGYVGEMPKSIRNLRSLVADSATEVSVKRESRVVMPMLRYSLGRAIICAEESLGRGDTERPVVQLASFFKTAADDLESARQMDLLAPAERMLVKHLDGVMERHAKEKPRKDVIRNHLNEFVIAGRWLKRQAPEADLTVSLPTTSVHVEALVGHCSGCSETTTRDVEARTGTLEAERRLRDIEAERRKLRIEAGELAADTPTPLELSVDLKKDPTQ